MIFLFFFATLSGDEVRGFVTEDQEGRLFLTERPNIPSCCVAKETQAIELVGDFSHLSRWGAVTVSGKLIQTSSGLKLVADRLAEGDLLTEKVAAD